VVLMDADSLVLRPLDQLLDTAAGEALYTVDAYLGGGCANGGFAAVRPAPAVFAEAWRTVLAGALRARAARMALGTGG
jgi:hypothetical protein